MNDIDIEEGRSTPRYSALADELASIPINFYDPVVVVGAARRDAAVAALRYAAAMFDAIETGRQWETIARQAAPLVARLARVLISVEAQEWLAAFRDVAARTPGPHHDGGVG